MCLSVFSLFPVLAFSAPHSTSHQVLLSPETHKSHGISQTLFNELNDLAKIVDITNCLQTPESISYPFECNSFCREFPGLKLLKQWNTADDLGDSYGYIAISHEGGKERIIIAFAGAYGLANAIVDISTTPGDYLPLFSGVGSSLDSCPGCKVHGDLHKEWLNTEELIGATVGELVTQYILGKENPYQLILVGHKLGGAVATLAAVDFEARGWNPIVTTFGQPKVGNEAFTEYLTGKFTPSTFRRVTHVSDPVPQFPLDGLGFSHYQHEYFISKEFAPYTAADIQICNADSSCAARVYTGNSRDLDWGSSDYFHHTDTCIREPTSFFSFSTSLFIIAFRNLEDDNSTAEFGELQVGNTKQKRDIPVDPEVKLIKPIPNSKFAKTFAMVEPAPKKVPPEYEDEELYHAMKGFDKAQGMWIKPQKKAPVTEMHKRGVIDDSDITFAKTVPDSRFKKTFAMVEPPEPEPEAEVYVPEYEDEEIYNSMSGFKKAQSMWVKPQETSGREKRDIGTDFGIIREAASGVVERRDIDRALKFFHAPKEVLNAQLAANDEAAAYEAHRKAQQDPNSNPDAAPGEKNPDEDYYKKGGSVLMLNGRPLEVDGRPVRSKVQKRSNGRGPGMGFGHGKEGRRGGLRRGGGDRVTELSSSSPPTTESDTVVGIIENAAPRSLEEEVVNVQKGRNFVLMNGVPMPANFAQKVVSTEPTKRSYISGGENRLPGEHVSDTEQLLRLPGSNFCGHHVRRPEVHSRIIEKYVACAGEDFSRIEEHFSYPQEYFPVYTERLSTPGETSSEPEQQLTIPGKQRPVQDRKLQESFAGSQIVEGLKGEGSEGHVAGLLSGSD